MQIFPDYRGKQRPIVSTLVVRSSRVCAGESGVVIALPLNGITLHIDGLSKLRLDETGEELMMADVRRQVQLSTADFIGIQETQALLSRVEPHHGDLLREATKAAPLPRLADVLRRLVAEQVSIVNMRAVLEAVAENGSQEPSTA